MNAKTPEVLAKCMGVLVPILLEMQPSEINEIARDLEGLIPIACRAVVFGARVEVV